MVPKYARPTAYEYLKQLSKEARYDEALIEVDGYDPRTILTTVHDPYLRLRFACVCSDVLDYGGLYARAEQMIKDLGENAYKRLNTILTPVDILDPAYTKQECWARDLRKLVDFSCTETTNLKTRAQMGPGPLSLRRGSFWRDV
jgi:hypothetical protein